MKVLIFSLLVLCVWLQYKLWLAPSGIIHTVKLNRDISTLEQENKVLQDRNSILKADVRDLKTGNEAIEDQARSELGMIKNDEVFYQVVN